MPTIISHAVTAFAITRTTFGNDRKLIVAAAICSMLPDADVASFYFGIPYSSMWGHRGITHSIFFGALLAIAASLLWPPGKDRRRAVLCLFLAVVSHPLLDACTDGGRGIAFFAPFSSQRFFFPWRPLPVSRIGLDALQGDYGQHVLLAEIFWIWLPAALLLIVAALIKKRS